MTHRLLPYGDRAVLLEVDDGEAVLALERALRDDPPPGVADLVPAARTLLAVAAEGHDLPDLRRALDRAAHEVLARGLPGGTSGGASGRPADPEGPVVELPVVYDGPDLADVARLTGLTEAEVVAAHTGQEWRVAFGGFAPGFAYLVGDDDRLHVPRRPEPRTRVPAGSVGLAGEHSGVYPRASPGGWQLLGRTDAVLWDLDQEPPALLRPGVRVRFVDVGAP